MEAIFLGRAEIPSPKVVIALSSTYKKPHSKEEPYRSAVSDILSYRQTLIMLLLYKDINCDVLSRDLKR